MEINVRDDSKQVEIWLSNAEKQDRTLRENLKPLYQAYRAKKYFVAVFVSGQRDLADATSDLLRYNRKRFAQAEARRERQSTGLHMS